MGSGISSIATPWPGTTSDGTSQDGPRPTEDMATPVEDMQRWAEEKKRRLKDEVWLEAEVDENCRTLFKAALKGNWKAIEKILNKEPEKITATIITTVRGVKNHFTVLDVAIIAGQDQLVDKLLERFPPEHVDPGDLIALAAGRGRIRMVKALVPKINDNPEIMRAALLSAIELVPKQKELILYMARRTPASIDIISNLIVAGHLDIAFYCARKRYHPPNSVKTEIENCSVTFLDMLAVMPAYFRSGARLNFWKNYIYKCIPLYLVDTTYEDSKDNRMATVCFLRALNWIKTSLWNFATVPFIKEIGELKLRHNCSLEFAKLLLDKMKIEMTTPEILKYLLTREAILDAASRGIFEFVDLCLNYFPELMWDVEFATRLTIKIVKGRHVELFRLVHTHNATRYMVTDFEMGVGLMEAVTEWSSGRESPDVSGAAFHMQRELQWFRVVDVSSFPTIKWMKYREDKKSYWEVFVDQRKELLKDAGTWMKDTSSSCSLVATLIITIAFAAAFTVPGGNDGNTGIPIFLKNGSFMVFAIADTLALLFSVSATLIFLSILTSRYAIGDFLHSLPRKIIYGLTFLFLSLVFMLVAFGSALTIVLKERLKWIYIPITLLAAFPVVLFTILQLPLYVEMVKSTFWPRLYRPLKPWNDLAITQ